MQSWRSASGSLALWLVAGVPKPGLVSRLLERPKFGRARAEFLEQSSCRGFERGTASERAAL
eukprot:11196187-Alexandrium_andersonii.AAC.1